MTSKTRKNTNLTIAESLKKKVIDINNKYEENSDYNNSSVNNNLHNVYNTLSNSQERHKRLLRNDLNVAKSKQILLNQYLQKDIENKSYQLAISPRFKMLNRKENMLINNPNSKINSLNTLSTKDPIMHRASQIISSINNGCYDSNSHINNNYTLDNSHGNKHNEINKINDKVTNINYNSTTMSENSKHNNHLTSKTNPFNEINFMNFNSSNEVNSFIHNNMDYYKQEDRDKDINTINKIPNMSSTTTNKRSNLEINMNLDALKSSLIPGIDLSKDEKQTITKIVQQNPFGETKKLKEMKFAQPMYKFKNFNNNSMKKLSNNKLQTVSITNNGNNDNNTKKGLNNELNNKANNNNVSFKNINNENKLNTLNSITNENSNVLNINNNNKGKISIAIDVPAYDNPYESQIFLKNNIQINKLINQALTNRSFVVNYNQFNSVKKKLEISETNSKYIRVTNLNHKNRFDMNNAHDGNPDKIRDNNNNNNNNTTTNSGSININPTTNLTNRSLDNYNNTIKDANNTYESSKVIGKVDKIEKAASITNTSLYNKDPKNNDKIIDLKKGKKKKLEKELILYIPLNFQGKCEMFSYFKYSYKKFPPGREQFSFYSDGDDYVLFGGICSNKKNIIWGFKPANLEFFEYNQKNYPAFNYRYGHTGVVYQKKLYLFGGKTFIEKYCDLGDLEIFNLEDKTWSFPQVFTKSMMKTRRNHIAEIIGNQMFIHGGIDESNNILNCFYVLSFNPLKWYNVIALDKTDTRNKHYSSPHLAYHSCCLVLPTEIKLSSKLNIYKIPELHKSMLDHNSDSYGLYVFGGKKNNDEISNELWILKFGKNPVEWVLAEEIKGKPPLPRYQHSMNFYEERNFIIIHGGRNDQYDIDTFALSSTFLLDLERWQWIEVKLFNNLYENFRVMERCSHHAVVYHDKLIIFGGMNSENFLGSHLFIVNFNFNKLPDNDLENYLKTIQDLGTNKNLVLIEKYNTLKAKKRRISTVEEFNLPRLKNIYNNDSSPDKIANMIFKYDFLETN